MLILLISVSKVYKIPLHCADVRYVKDMHKFT